MDKVDQELPGAVVVADMQAGLEHLSWAGGTLRSVDLLLVVVEPTAKTLLTADRAHRLALDLGIHEVAFVGNRSSEADRPRLEAFAAQRGAQLMAVIPDDDAVRQADRVGRCVLDTAPGAPSVRAIEGLAERLEARISASL